MTIKACQEVARIKQSLKQEGSESVVLEVREIELLPFKKKEAADEKKIRIVQKIKKYLQHGFYFAHNFRITLNAQKRQSLDPHEE